MPHVPFYLVMAHQYGCKQGHIYAVGIYKTLEAATRNAKKEAHERAGKYALYVYETKHPNRTRPQRLKLVLEIKSPYEGKLKSFSQTEALNKQQ